jgi:NAD(P)-dependent dehydrogenase (short-subunit alcohol dehydrogenase family)
VARIFGKLDILVNNAGFMALPKPIKFSDEVTYWKIFEINLRGTYRVTKAFLPLILSSKNGLKIVVNLSSVAAHNIRPDSSAYGISKFAILRFTEIPAAENKDLVAFCIHPGAIMSKLAEALPGELQAGEHIS